MSTFPPLTHLKTQIPTKSSGDFFIYIPKTSKKVKILMRKLILALFLIAVLVSPVFADDSARSTLGGKVDMPNLIRFTQNLTLGLEGGKDVYTNIFQESGAWLEDDKGYFGYIKITYTGSLVNFSK